MTNANPAIQLEIFTANAYDMARFLTVAMNSISSARHELSASEKAGFCLCMAALKQNICGAHEANMEVWEIEGGNA